MINPTIYLSSPVPRERIYANQTAILTWLKRVGHQVEFVRDYEGDPVTRRIRTPLPTPPTSQLAPFIGKPCPYCTTAMTDIGEHQVTRDHKHPKSKGGTFKNGNKLIACRKCNGDKGNLTLPQWHSNLIAKHDPRAKHVAWIIQTAITPDTPPV